MFLHNTSHPYIFNEAECQINNGPVYIGDINKYCPNCLYKAFIILLLLYFFSFAQVFFSSWEAHDLSFIRIKFRIPNYFLFSVGQYKGWGNWSLYIPPLWSQSFTCFPVFPRPIWMTPPDLLWAYASSALVVFIIHMLFTRPLDVRWVYRFGQ